MQIVSKESDFFGTEGIWKILLKIAPPVMLAQIIQAFYNIIDSYFIGKYNDYGLTALSVIFPIQYIIIAIAVGTGVGVNTQMARLFALKRNDEANKIAGAGMALAILSWVIFSIIIILFLGFYVRASVQSNEVYNYSMLYGNIVCIGSIGMFLESIWTKIHQAKGNMKLPMVAQIIGAVINIILDPILIFGFGVIPEMGIAGAGIATVIGQIAAAIITGVSGIRKIPKISEAFKYAGLIYKVGYPSIFMQAMCTVYIMVLNIILAKFSDNAVTVLGLYYKIQSFFFIPIMGLQTCIVPVLSYNYARNSYDRCKKIMINSILIASILMFIGTLCFEFIPKELIGIFSKNTEVMKIGVIAFRLIGISFIPAVFSLILPVFFHAIGRAKPSVWLALIRQIFCLIPLFYIFAIIGLNYTWIAFPLSEIITGTVGIIMYIGQLKKWQNTINI